MTKRHAIEIAEWFITYFHDRDQELSNLKLQKLLYYAQGWHLVFFDEPLFREPLEAWVHGPVVPPIYRRYKEFGWGDIQVESSNRAKLDADLESFLKEIVEVFGDYAPWQLESMTHQERPWIEARSGLPDGEPSQTEISLETMKAFFTKVSKRGS